MIYVINTLPKIAHSYILPTGFQSNEKMQIPQLLVNFW